MKKILSFLINVDSQYIDSSIIISICIDILTIGLGTVILLNSLFSFQINEDGVSLGATLLIFGILIKIWKKEFKNQ